MSDCSHLKADWQKLAAMAAIFKNPASFAYHVGKDLMINGKDIYAEIKLAIKDYDAKNWEDFGFQIGEASAKIILGSQSETQIAVAQMIEGMLEPIGGTCKFEDLIISIKNQENAALILDQAINSLQTAFKQNDVQSVLAGVILTMASVKEIQHELPVCKVVDMEKYEENGIGLN
jgi:hypothetical protein